MLIVLNKGFENKIIENFILKENRVTYIQYIFLVGNKSVLICLTLTEQIQIIVVYYCFF